MLRIEVPGRQPFEFKHLVCDFNGTLACDGSLLPGLADRIRRLSASMEIHIITADTFGRTAQEVGDLPVTLTILAPENQDQGKHDYIPQLGAGACVCLGNGRNDKLMLEHAALGICIIDSEGTCKDTLLSGDVICRTPTDALDLLVQPKRLMATLRN